MLRRLINLKTLKISSFYHTKHLLILYFANVIKLLVNI